MTFLIQIDGALSVWARLDVCGPFEVHILSRKRSVTSILKGSQSLFSAT